MKLFLKLNWTPLWASTISKYDISTVLWKLHWSTICGGNSQINNVTHNWSSITFTTVTKQWRHHGYCSEDSCYGQLHNIETGPSMMHPFASFKAKNRGWNNELGVYTEWENFKGDWIIIRSHFWNPYFCCIPTCILSVVSHCTVVFGRNMFYRWWKWGKGS